MNNTATQPIKNFKISIREAFTPAWDSSIGQKFTGNHSAFRVSFQRNGDELRVEHHGCQGWGPCRPLLFGKTYSIKAFFAELEESLEGVATLEIVDDMPEGFSLAVTPQ